MIAKIKIPQPVVQVVTTVFAMNRVLTWLRASIDSCEGSECQLQAEMFAEKLQTARQMVLSFLHFMIYFTNNNKKKCFVDVARKANTKSVDW